MREKIKKYLDILKIELSDLEEDLSALEDIYKERQRNREITNYVLLENTTVIQRELKGMKRVVEAMEDIHPETYSNLEELIQDLYGRFQEQLADYQVPETLQELLMRKLVKVKEYVGG